MVSFSCESCGDILTKKKLDSHRGQCHGASFTCIDCMTHFMGTQYRAHTSCMTEAEKYEGALHKPKQQKNQRKQNDTKQPPTKQVAKPHANGHRAPYVEDAPDVDNPTRTPHPPPPAPSPPPSGTERPKGATDENTPNVFDFLVNDQTPNASKVSLPGPPDPEPEQMKMVDHAPSVFETSKSLAKADAGADTDDEGKNYDVAYEENGYSYGAGPIPPAVYPSKVANASMEFMTPAPKKKKDRSRKTDVPSSATTSDKKRKRRAEDAEDADTPMADAPSSVLNHPGTPMLHSGLTGGLSKLMRSPSLEAEDGHSRTQHETTRHHRRQRYQDPSSPLKRTRRDEKEKEKEKDANGNSIKNRAERLVSSMFGGSVASASSANSQHEPANKTLVRSRRRSSSDNESPGQLEFRRSKKTAKVRNPSNSHTISSATSSSADPRKSKRKSSAQVDGDRPSRRVKQIEYPERERHASYDDGHEMVPYRQPNHPDELQRAMAAHFLSLVTKGPESGRGFSMNKVLKRFHREFSEERDGYEGEREHRGREVGRSRADAERRADDEKDLWRTLRVKQNERGEIVLFF